MEVIKYYQEQFIFELPSLTLARRTNKFLANLCQCDNPVEKVLCVCNVPVFNVSLLSDTDSLWPPYVIGGPIYFCPVISIFFFFFIPRLISAVAGWMSTILPHMVWP